MDTAGLVGLSQPMVVAFTDICRGVRSLSAPAKRARIGRARAARCRCAAPGQAATPSSAGADKQLGDIAHSVSCGSILLEKVAVAIGRACRRLERRSERRRRRPALRSPAAASATVCHGGTATQHAASRACPAAGRSEEVFASLAEALAVIERWRRDYNQVRPHSAHRGLTPEAAHLQSAGARLCNPDQLRRAPATIEAPEPL